MKFSELQVGDKVRCISDRDHRCLRVGFEYEVVEVVGSSPVIMCHYDADRSARHPVHSGNVDLFEIIPKPGPW